MALAVPLDAEFSWISHRFPGSENAHIWTLAPGTDGGLFIGMVQPGRGQITASRPMYNLASWLYSVEDGAHFDEESETFDLASLRLSWGESIYDFGFGGGVSAMVPLVGAMEDVLSMNGWWVGEAGNYHLVFRGDGQCDGCELTVHLTGQMSAVPLPAAVWLLGSGLLVLIPYRKPEHSRTQ